MQIKERVKQNKRIGGVYHQVLIYAFFTDRRKEIRVKNEEKMPA